MTALFADSPVLIASGCGGSGRELDAHGGLAGVGGFVSRTLTLTARQGWGLPRITEVDAGLVCATGLPNSGPEHFLALELPWLVQAGVAPIASLVAGDEREWAELARLLALAPGLRGLEINVADDAGLMTDRSPAAVGATVAAVRTQVRDLPLLVKLDHDPSHLTAAVAAAVDHGADAVVVGGGLPALMSDGRPGTLVGPAVHPVALRSVATVRAAFPDLAIVAVGGVRTAAHARAFLSVGATAVQVGSALFADPTAAARIAADLSTP